MNLKNFLPGILIAGTLLLNACGSKSVKYDDAVSRIIANTEPGFMMSVSIGDLLKEGGISTKENIPMMAQMLLAEKIDYLSDPSKAGMDLSGKSYLGVGGDAKGPIVWIIAKVGDKEKFEKVLKDEGNEKFEEIEGYNTQTENDATVGWNNELFLTVVAKGQDSKEVFKKIVTSLKEEKKPSAAFEKFVAAKADMAFFTNFDKFAELQKHIPQDAANQDDMEMLNRVTNKMKGSSSMLIINFENDKILADLTNNYSNAVKNEMDFFSKEGTPDALLTMVGSGEMNGFVAMNGNIQKGLDWLISVVGKEDIFEEARARTRLDVTRILESLKGNILFSFLGFKQEESRTVPQMSLIATLNNNYIETLVDSIAKDKKKGNYYSVGSEWEPAYVSFRPGIVFYTNDEALAANTTPNEMPQLDGVAKKALAKPFSFYFDLNSIIGQIDKSDMTQKLAEKLKYTVGGMDMSGGHAELVLNNGGKNALWTIINLGVEASASVQPPGF
ncbi:MAG TPA: hypothetical protein VD905_10500 [Flavobacteriales bacterium]|nr:hypothetical protein [Flavobacteriales bacterium]